MYLEDINAKTSSRKYTSPLTQVCIHPPAIGKSGLHNIFSLD